MTQDTNTASGAALTDDRIDAIVLHQTGFDGDGTQHMTIEEMRRVVRAALASTPAQPVAILFEHEDGRYAINPDTTGEPAWHRLGPVELSALAAPAARFDSGALQAAQHAKTVAWLYESPMPDGSVFVGASAERLQIGVGTPQGTIEKPLYLAAPPTAQAEGWISVDERLPGEQGHDSEQVLVFINGHCELTSMECRQGGAWGLRLGYFDADRQVFRVHGRPEPHVTHWRQEPPAPPLPDAPGPGTADGESK